MNPLTYQKEAHRFANHHSKAYPFLGLAEEAGEVCGKVAKFIRKHDGTPPKKSGCRFKDEAPAEWEQDNEKFLKDLSKELGDVLWMVAEICSIYGLDLEQVMEENIAKLEDRLSRGVIVGEGENR